MSVSFIWKSFKLSNLLSHVTQNGLYISSRLYSEKKEIYNTPRPARDPPDNWNPDKIDHDGIDPPEFLPKSIFRQLKSDECLGPGASKCDTYKNAEYFAYHRFTWAELIRTTQKLREKGRHEFECKNEISTEKKKKD